jgi:succinate dehydrogenase / fumarate reductase flavoprotein subunit
MQDLVGIVRREEEMVRALDIIAQLKERTAAVGVMGNREFNPGWHTALDLKNLLTVSEAVARAGLERKESRGAHFRDDYPEKSEAFAGVNTIVSRAHDDSMQIRLEPIQEMPEHLQRVIEEMK